MSPAVLALIICIGAAILEGIAAGRGVRARLEDLRRPSYSPSLAVWILIGTVYYVICYVILYRLLRVGLTSSKHEAALVLLIILMILNAGWSILFFRYKALRASFLAFIPYGAIALVLMSVLASIDALSALSQLCYVTYLGYASSWAYRLWKLNSD